MKQSILACLLFVCVNSFAANKSVAPQDTTLLQGKSWQISEMVFLEQYGKDDTSRAMIDYYFHKRRGGRRTMLYSGITAFGSALAIALILNNDNFAGESAILRATPFFIFAELGLIAMVIGFFGWVSHSRHKLFTLLRDYQNGRSITIGIKTNNIFKRYLEMEQHKHSK